MPPETKIKVLIVDDEVNLAKTFQAYLEASGKFHVETVSDGASAINKIQAETWDAVLTDLNMPGGVNGVDVAKAAISAGIKKVLIMTTEDKSDFEQVEGVTVLEKPLSFKKLREALDN